MGTFLLNSQDLNQNILSLNTEKFYQIFLQITKNSFNIEQIITLSSLFLPLIVNDYVIIQDIIKESNVSMDMAKIQNSEFSKDIIPFVILSTFHGNLDQSTLSHYLEIYFKINGSTEYNKNSAIAAALFFISERDFTDLFNRYFTIKSYLSRFGEDGMMVSAVLLAQIPITIPEILDILRTASDQISKYFQGMSGLENMNLAIKMFLQSSYNPNFINKSINMIDSEPILQTPPFGLPMSPFIAGSVRTRMYPLNFTTAMYFRTNFISTRRYYQDHNFHPMHSHFMQG